MGGRFFVSGRKFWGVFTELREKGELTMLMAEYQHHLIDARNATRQVTYRCPACHEVVCLHRGHQVAPYFAHRPQTACWSGGEGETAEHVTGKRQLALFFRPWGPTSFERVLPTIQQRADVWGARTPRPVALEFQCSPLAVDQVAARTAGYRQLGIPVIWLLGRRYARQRLNWRLIERYARWLPRWGLCLLFWDVADQCLRVKHHLQQDALGQYLGWVSRVPTLRAFLAGQPRTFHPRPLNLARVRHNWSLALLRGAAPLRPIQEQLYGLHHHLIQFPTVLASNQATPPIFGRGVLLWRILVGAWLFAAGPRVTPAQLQRWGWQALQLVGGQATAVQFSARPAVALALHALLTDLERTGYLRRATGGWVVQQQPQWVTDS
nr:competence protein CoiA family protein [Levilactobacillus spicheri]